MATTRDSCATALAEPVRRSQAPEPSQTRGDKRAGEKARIDAARREALADPEMRIVLAALAR
jgi:hypothetical protein